MVDKIISICWGICEGRKEGKERRVGEEEGRERKKRGEGKKGGRRRKKRKIKERGGEETCMLGE